MAQRKTLTEKQVALLQWIGDGCPEGVMTGDFYRISAAALRNRGLITTSGRGPTWTAHITEAGRQYLRQVDGPNPPIPRQANASVTQQLVDDVIAAGGALRVPSRSRYQLGAVDYAQRAQIAEQHGRVPVGKRLVTRHVEGELEIRLEDAIAGTEVLTRPVPVPQRAARLHPVAQRFRDDTEKHEVSRTQLARCVRIVHALVIEAERRGFTVSNVQTSLGGREHHRWVGEDGHIIVTIRDHSYRLRVFEEKVVARGKFDAETRYRRSVPYPQYLPSRSRKCYDADGTGRLQIKSDAYGQRSGRPATWADRQSWTLEDKLPALLQELEIRVAEDDYRAAKRQRETEERKRNFEIAKEDARKRFLDHYRAQVLQEQVTAWQEAAAARRYLSALEERHGANPLSEDWITWVRTYVENRYDPLASPPAMPLEPDIMPDDLKPFLRDVRPYEPRDW